MPRYKITSPDGRVITVSGDHAPTESDAAQIFATLPPKSDFPADKIAAAQDAVNALKKEQQSETRPISGIANFFTKNIGGRLITAGLQGLNKGNPMTGFGMIGPDDVIRPENMAERALQTAAEFATPAGISAKAMGAIAKAPKIAGALAKSKVGRFAANVLTPAAMPLEYAGAAAGGALTGAADPEDTIGKIATGVVGGGLGAAGLAAVNRGAVGIGKNIIGKTTLSEALRDAERNTKPRFYDKLLGENAMTRRELEEVPFGQLSQARLDELNGLRNLNSLIKVDNGRISVPSDRVKHLYESRSVDPNYSPRKLSEIINDAIYSDNSIMSRQAGKHFDTIAFINKESTPKDIAYVGARDNKNIIVSGQKMRASNIKARQYIDLDGRPSVPSESLSQSQLKGPIGQVNNIINQTPTNVKPLLSDIISDRKAYSALQKGIHSSENFSNDIQYEIAPELRNSSERVKKGVFDILNKPQYDKNSKLISEQFSNVGDIYKDFLKQYGDERIDKSKVEYLRSGYSNISKMFKNVRANNPHLKKYPENSLAFLQKVSSNLKEDLRRAGSNATGTNIKNLKAANSQLDKLIDERFAGHEYIDKAYRRTIRQMQLMDELSELPGSELSDFAKKINTRENQSLISELFGPETSEEFAKYMRQESQNFDRLKNLNARAESKMSQVGIPKPLWRESAETIGSALGTIADFGYNAAVRKARTKFAQDLVSGKKTPDDIFQLSKFLKQKTASAPAGIKTLAPRLMLSDYLNQEDK
ncbi:MAG: hypothetical protein LBJ18_03685 [Rickettsiales bacterium]|jgi:hypothetical protein|nr:hypothetical protein [Rickettsiales bacterium]